MNEAVSGINWLEIVGNEPVDEMWTGFHDLLSTLVDRYIPLYTKVNKRKTRTISRKKLLKKRKHVFVGETIKIGQQKTVKEDTSR